MSILLIFFLALIGLFCLGSIKHSMSFKIKKGIFFLVLFLVVLGILSSYFDFSAVLGKGNLLAKTGAAVFGSFKENVIIKPLIKKDDIGAVKKVIYDGSDSIAKRLDSLSLSYSKAVKAN